MPTKQSEIVKASVDLKKRTLQLEGPQEFVEKYLNHVIENCKPFVKKNTKPEPTKEERKETKQYRKFVAESLFNFSISLIILSLLNRSLYMSDNLEGWHKIITSGWYYLAYFGIFFLLMSVYVRVPGHHLQAWLIKNIFHNRFLVSLKYLGFAVIMILFGQNLIQQIQTDWAAVLGQLSIALGAAFFAYSIYIPIKEATNGKQG